MKNVSQDIIDKEEGTKRQPAELYHMWYEGFHWRYTSGDVAIEYEGYTYEPAYIKRGPVTFDIKLDSNTLALGIPKVNQLIAEFIATIPVALIWISVHKIHRDGIEYGTTSVFMGQVKGVLFKGLEASVSCVGFEHFLGQVVPRYRYGILCQHTLFDPLTCGRDGLSEDDYKITAQITGISSSGLVLTSEAFASQEDKYYTQGKLLFGSYRTMLTAHSGSTVTLRYKMANLSVGDVVQVVAGCYGTRAACDSKFNNLDNCFNFEDIPRDNPTAWIGA